MKDSERDDDDRNEEQEDGEIYHLDLDEEGHTTVDELAREAVDAVSRPGRRRGGETGSLPDQEVTVRRLEEEIADLRDRSIRTLADFENFRKRTEREQGELRRRLLTETFRELLPVMDNLERAMVSSGTVEDLKAGVEMIVRQLREVLRQHGVEEVQSLGKPFDPALHEAVAREEDPEAEEATVAEELQRGYTIQGRLLRPAMVRVAMPREQADDS